MTKITWTNEQRTLGELVPWPRNPRQIKGRQAERLVESVEEFGQVETLAIGPGNEIYNGHQRLNVLRAQHGADFVVDVRVSSRPLTEKEREKLTVYLHKGAAGEWDFDTLANEFEMDELIEWGFEPFELGIDADALAGKEVNDPGAQVSKADELQQKWNVQPGDLWQLGDHRLICGDCTDPATVARVMGGEKAQAVVTDPPYGQNQAGVTNDAPEQLQGIVTGAIANLPIKNAVVIAFSSPRTFPMWLDAARAAGHKFERMLWMYKAAQETFPWRGWLLKSEAILATSVGDGQWQDVHPYSHDCYYKSEVSGQLAPDSGWHGSVKPLDVVQDLTQRVSAPGAIVYEPFSGSGTTIIACEQLGRRCRAVEIAPAYCAVALERWSVATGKEPVRLETKTPTVVAGAEVGG